MSVAESTSQQSDVLWRNKRKRCGSNNSSCSNNDEPSSVDLVLQTPAAYAKHTAGRRWSSPARPNSTSVYITLAAESPVRTDDESEDSVYDSFHAQETDECRDTSDTDSYDTDGFATMDVIEYEVASGSSSNTDLYSHDSSSGTDDFVVTAAQLARAIFTQSKSMRTDSASDSSTPDQFDTLADWEESDAPTDPELGRADYWTCVKCKNRQNNPMYRYCERCYQIRKTHFPPRPQLRKCRSSPRQYRSSPSLKGTQQSSSSQKRAYSSDDDDDRTSASTSSDCRNSRFKKRSTNQKKKASSAGESGPFSPSDAAVDSDLESVRTDTHKSGSEGLPIRNKFLNNAAGAGGVPPRILPNRLNILAGSTPDSGFQSCGSSADLSPDVAPSNLGSCSQETFCSDLEEAAPLAVTATSSTVSNSSAASSSMGSHAIRSISSCSTQLIPNAEPARVQRKRHYSDTDSASPEPAKSSLLDESELDLTSATIVPTTRDDAAGAEGDSSYGMCMMCLTQPKNGVFVHSRFLHLCCCYRCAVKVWNKQKRCPICNCKVKNVMKLFVH